MTLNVGGSTKTSSSKRGVKPRSKRLPVITSSSKSPTRAHAKNESLPASPVQDLLSELNKASDEMEAKLEEKTSTSGDTAHEDAKPAKDPYGYRMGSDVQVVVEELLKGGADKHDVAQRILNRFGEQTTRSGKPKPVSTIMNQVLEQMLARGFVIKSTWTLAPPEDGVIGPRVPKAARPPRMPTAAAAAALAKITKGLKVLDVLEDADPEVFSKALSEVNDLLNKTSPRGKPRPKPRSKNRPT